MLSLRQKQIFYDQLARLLKSGIPFSKALLTLSGESSGNLKLFLMQLQRAAESGQSISDAFETLPITPLEKRILQASERSGRLEQACRYLSGYFTVLDETRSTIIQKSLYPLFLLHFGVLALSLPLYFSASPGAFIAEVIGLLAGLYFIAGLIGFGVWKLLRSARISAAADRFVLRIPVLGKVHHYLSLARFCATYEMQLQAGLHILEILPQAAQASQSGAITETIWKIMPEIRGGSALGAFLSSMTIFPEDMKRSILVGEETGELDEELKMLAKHYQEQAISRLNLLANTLPKALYIGILLYFAYRIVSFYMGYFQNMSRLINGD